jgi:DNA-binding MarR family transcriptional regulator
VTNLPVLSSEDDNNEDIEPTLAVLSHIISQHDMTCRQLSVLFVVYSETELQTVRGLASRLDLSKPAITRALDRLTEWALIRRQVDTLDRRSVQVRRTQHGTVLMRQLRSILAPTPVNPLPAPRAARRASR